MKYRVILCGGLLATAILLSSLTQARRYPRHRPRCCRQFIARISSSSAAVEAAVAAVAVVAAAVAVAVATREWAAVAAARLTHEWAAAAQPMCEPAVAT